jgi:hypothetical protein
MKIYETLQ